ncbi:helix-turn-helix transcriptional regulator [Rhodococcus sp. NPDC058532]|uniref:helix-turn-helix transcriptional regulator n=1 Tax=Rhodococcus sp. NPDC058532 TaxID=3346540 RepID=UPI00364B2CA5
MIRLDPEVLDATREIYHLSSDEKLAHKLGISGSTVANLRAGKTAPTIATLMAIKKATGRPLDSLVQEIPDRHAA